MRKKHVFVCLLMGSVTIMAGLKLRKKESFSAHSIAPSRVSLSGRERLEDIILRKHVRGAVNRQLQSGAPIARYDTEKRCVYMEYQDGKRVYPSEA